MANNQAVQNKKNGTDFAGTPKKVLLVQCSNLPQWFYLAKILGELYPSWKIDGLAIDHPHTRQYLEIIHFPGTVYFQGSLPDQHDYDLVILPLLNRGYLKAKLNAWNLPVPKQQVNYSGELLPVSRTQVIRSAILPRCQPNEEFTTFLEEFPHRPLGEKVLFAESCDPLLIGKTSESLAKLVPTRAEITRVSPMPFRQLWREYRNETFDSAVVYFAGDRGYLGLKLLPFLMRISKILVVNENGQYFYSSFRSLVRFFWVRLRHGQTSFLLAPRILLFQTEGSAYTNEAAKQILDSKHFQDARICLLCRKEDLELFSDNPAFHNIISYSKKEIFSEIFRIWKQIRGFRPNVNIGIFTGHPTFLASKISFFLLGSRRRFILNASLDGSWFRWWKIRRLLKREPLLVSLVPGLKSKVLVVQTESVEYTLAMIDRLKRPELYPSSRITLLVNRDDSPRFQESDIVEGIEIYHKNMSFLAILKLIRKLRRLRLDTKCALFTARSVYPQGKILFFLIPARHRLAFNASLDAYWLRLWKLPRIFKREPLRVDLLGARGSRALLIETEAKDTMETAISVMQDPTVIPKAKLTVFCEARRRDFYSGLPGVTRVITYSNEETWKNWESLSELLKERPDLVSALFTGRRIFLKQKLLFWLFPIRNRLVFNRHLDCFYLDHRNFGKIFQSDSRPVGTGPVETVIRFFLRIILFFPRFGYLVLWNGIQMRKRKRLNL